MYDHEILKSFKHCKHFVGVFARDQLPALEQIKKEKPFGLVLNLDKYGDPGSHWVAIIFLKNNKGEYFDSFGFPPLHTDVAQYLNKNFTSGWIFNPVTLQHPFSVSCGEYTIAFLKNRFNNKSFLEFINSFGVNLQRNEVILKNGLVKNRKWIHESEK